MKYMGSKARHAKHMLPIMLKHRSPDQTWVEPFVGGGNMIDKVTGDRLGADANEYVIEALKLIRDNPDTLPVDNKAFTEEDYKRIKSDDSNRGLKGYTGYALSYAGKWFGGWRRDGAGKRDYVREAVGNAQKQSALLQGVKLVSRPYDALDIPPASIVYCDPPYADTTSYKTGAFDHAAFWQWCRDQVQAGHTVFVSEYQAPDDWVCIWQKQVNNTLTKDTGSKQGIERLFVHESQKGLYA